MRLSLANAVTLVSIIILAVGACVWVNAGTTGVVSGVVKDAQSGEPLSGVNIMLDGTNLTTVTNAEGKFTIINVAPGDYSVTAELIGYAIETVGDVQVTMDVTTDVDVSMTQETMEEEVVVVTRPRPMIDAGTVNTLNLMTPQQEQLTRTEPGSMRTVAGVVGTLPGVSVTPDGSGQIHIRGGRADQTGWYIEGIPITDPNTGMFGTNIYTTGAARFQTYTGGFSAEYGNALAGVLNEVKKTGVDMTGFSTSAEGGSDAFRSAFIEYGGGSSDTFNYYVGSSLQQSNVDTPIVKEQRYMDNALKMVMPSENDTYTFIVTQGVANGFLENQHSITNNDVATPLENDYMEQRYGVAAIRWNHRFSPTSSLTLTPHYLYTSIVQNTLGGSISFATPNYMDIWSARYGMQMRYENKINDQHMITAGGSFLKSNNNYYLFFQSFPFYQADVDTMQIDAFVQDQIKLDDHWTAMLGLRYDGIKYDRTGGEYVVGSGYDGDPVSDVSESGIDPRLGISYALDDRTVWKLSWGKYRKFVPANAVQKRYFFPDTPMDAGGTTLEQYYPGLGATDPQRCTSAEISFEKQLNDTLAFRVTPFYSDFENIGFDAYDPVTGATQYKNLGEGKSEGVEIMFRKKMSDNWQAWLSYTYQIAKTNRADWGYYDDMFYAAWDQRHTLALVSDFRKGIWGHSLRLDMGSGYSDYGDPSLQLRSNPYMIATYNLTVNLPEGHSLGDQLYLGIYNIFDNRQGMQYRWDPGPVRVKDSYVPARFFSFGVNRAF